MRFVLATDVPLHPPDNDEDDSDRDSKPGCKLENASRTNIFVLIVWGVFDVSTHIALCGAAFGSCRGSTGMAANCPAYIASQIPPIPTSAKMSSQ